MTADPGHEPPREGARSARRETELRVVDALRSDGPSSQANLARRTGLSRASINNIVRKLEKSGDVAIDSGANGRETSVRLSRRRGSLIAIEMSATDVRGMIVSFDRRIRADVHARFDDDRFGPKSIGVVRRVVDSLVSEIGVLESELDGICVGLMAPIDSRTGTIPRSTLMAGWEGFSLRAELQQEFSTTVIVENDGNLSAFGEWTWGTGRGSDEFLYVRVSDRIGAGVVLNGRIYRGGTGLAAELGHLTMDEQGGLCVCGNRGCLTTLVSGPAILLQLQAAGQAADSLGVVIDRARTGDRSCVRVLSESGHHLGRALANVTKILAPSVIAVGGELAGAGHLVFDTLGASLEANSLHTNGPRTEARPAQFLPEDVCLFGGVALILSTRGEGLSDLPAWMLRPEAGLVATV